MIYIGTTGWDFKFWKGSFYPEKIDNKLKYYSKISAFTELRSTYTRIPSEEKVLSWFNNSPDNFIFVSRMLKDVTHNEDYVVDEEKITAFFDAFKPLAQKHQMTMVHFPMHFQRNGTTEEFLLAVLDKINEQFDGQILVEAPNRSWQKVDIRDELSKRSACLVGNDRRPIPSLMRSKSVYYLRLLGDKRTVPKEKFGKNPLDRDDDIKYWAEHIQFIDKQTDAVFVTMDNHFSGNAIEDAKLMANWLSKLNCKSNGFE